MGHRQNACCSPVNAIVTADANVPGERPGRFREACLKVEIDAHNAVNPQIDDDRSTIFDAMKFIDHRKGCAIGVRPLELWFLIVSTVIRLPDRTPIGFRRARPRAVFHFGFTRLFCVESYEANCK